MERSTIFYGKTYYKWPLSIAMLVYQRVYVVITWRVVCLESPGVPRNPSHQKNLGNRGRSEFAVLPDHQLIHQRLPPWSPASGSYEVQPQWIPGVSSGRTGGGNWQVGQDGKWSWPKIDRKTPQFLVIRWIHLMRLRSWKLIHWR